MRAKILSPTPQNLAKAAAALAQGEVVGMPTETVYGLAGAAFQPSALSRIFETKERPTFDPLIIHIGFRGKDSLQIEELERLKLMDGTQLSPLARTRIQLLIQTFWPGPLTLVLPKHEQVPELATSGLPSVAIRMPAHPIAQALITAAGTPVAAPSANRFGRISPTTAQAVAEELGDRIDWILDGGACEVGVESTVLLIELNGDLTLLRPGGLTRTQLETATGCSIQIGHSSSHPGAAHAAPGMLESHYAPVKPMYLLPTRIEQLSDAHWQQVAKISASSEHLGFLLQNGTQPLKLFSEKLGKSTQVRVLSPGGDLHEAARTLFLKMRSLDASDAQLIFAEPCSDTFGLGHAISDRLSRACRAKITGRG